MADGVRRPKLPIRLFVADIDGCVAEPYQPYSLDGLAQLAAHARSAGSIATHPELPAISLCSGRAYPYVEAVTQLLHLQVPVVFESGAGLFDPVQCRIEWHPDYTEQVDQQIRQMREFMVELCAASTATCDYGKRTQASLIGADKEEVRRLLPEVKRHVEQNAPELFIAYTPWSIDVLSPRFSKRTGLAWLAEKCGLTTDEIAFIGDTDGDIPGLQIVGASFAPANASDQVKKSVDQVMASSVVEGTLEAYGVCVLRNKTAVKADKD